MLQYNIINNECRPVGICNRIQGNEIRGDIERKFNKSGPTNKSVRDFHNNKIAGDLMDILYSYRNGKSSCKSVTFDADLACTAVYSSYLDVNGTRQKFPLNLRFTESYFVWFCGTLCVLMN
jgi:hypothetical protein